MSSGPQMDGGGGRAVTPEMFVSEDGSVSWNDLGSTIISVFILVFWYGPINLALAAGDAFTRVVGGTADYFAEFVRATIGAPGVHIAAAWGGAEEFVTDAGLLGYVVSLAIVLLTAYIVARGVGSVQ